MHSTLQYPAFQLLYEERYRELALKWADQRANFFSRSRLADSTLDSHWRLFPLIALSQLFVFAQQLQREASLRIYCSFPTQRLSPTTMRPYWWSRERRPHAKLYTVL